MRESVFVAGGAGYIGSHVCKTLARCGYTPIAYDNLSQGHRWAVRWGPLEVGDLADARRLDAVLDEYRPTAVIHLGALISAGESVADPGRYYENNVCGMLALLHAMRRHEVDRIVFSSSAAVYGTPETVPIPEHTPIAPVNPYGWSKAMCEQILADHARAYGIRAISLRYFNAAGADPEGELGEAHDPETHLLPLVLEAAAGLRPYVEVYGDNHPTPDGSCVRDFVHVTDLATAHMQALRRMAESPGARAYNLGNGEGASVLEVIRAAERLTGRPLRIRKRPPRAGDPPVLVADPRAAMEDFDWYPAFPRLEAQLAHAWQWLQGRIADTAPPDSQRAFAFADVPPRAVTD